MGKSFGYLVSDSKSEYYPNKKIKRNIIIRNGQIDHDDYYSYDDQENIIERSSDWRSGSTLYHSRYNYRWIYGQGIYGRKNTCIDLSDGSKTEYNYDFENRLKKKIEYDKDGKIVSSIEYIYNLQGKECKRIINGSYGEEEKFDVYGNTVYMKWYPNFYNLSDKDKFVSAITTIEYRYDSQGNWLMYKQYRNGAYNLCITREIEYK